MFNPERPLIQVIESKKKKLSLASILPPQQEPVPIPPTVTPIDKSKTVSKPTQVPAKVIAKPASKAVKKVKAKRPKWKKIAGPKICSSCGSFSTYIYNGSERWHSSPTGRLCHKCWSKQYHKAHSTSAIIT